MPQLSIETKPKIITLRNYTAQTWEEIAAGYDLRVSEMPFLGKKSKSWDFILHVLVKPITIVFFIESYDLILCNI